MSHDGTIGLVDVGGDVDTGLLYISTDSGMTWTGKESIRNWRGTAMSSDGIKMLAKSLTHPFRSINTGNDWILCSGPTNQGWDCCSDISGTILYVLGWDNSLFRSINSGVDWTRVFNLSYLEGVACSADGSIVILNSNVGIYISLNSGTSWNLRKASVGNLNGCACSANGSIMLSQAAWGAKLYVSTNTGLTWNEIAGTVGTWWGRPAMSADGSMMLAIALGYNPIWYSINYGTTWTQITDPLMYNAGGGGCAMSADGKKCIITPHEDYIYTGSYSTGVDTPVQMTSMLLFR
jgi:hypothetical protein